MCPPAQPSSPTGISPHWSDEQIFSILDECHQGFHLLPSNVLADSCPYQYQPSNLPEGIWYWVPSNKKKESIFGFWKARGEACEIYSNSQFSGWRATLEYFEGQNPRAQKTDWIMQEYSITLKESREKNYPEVSRSLCRVFFCNSSSSENEICSKDCKTIIASKEECDSTESVIPNTDTASKDVNLPASVKPSTDTTSKQYSFSETEAKKDCDIRLPPLAGRIFPNSSLQESSEIECFSTGDYLELKDLEDHESHSSSSQNSSCPSNLTDEYFDSLALLHELEEKDVGHAQRKYSTSRYSFTTSVGSNDVVMHLPSSGSIVGGTAITSVNGLLSDEKVLENAAKCNLLETRNECTSENSDSAVPSTSHVNGISTGEKKPASAGKTKRIKMYFCFIWL